MFKPLGAALAALVLASCGGGGGSDAAGNRSSTEATSALAPFSSPVQAKRRGAGHDLVAQPATVVNTITLNDQTLRAIGATSDGGYVAAWHSTGDALSMQAFDEAGARLGSEIHIPLEIPAAPTLAAFHLAVQRSSLAVLNDGSLVVLYTINGDFGSITNVYFQLFSRNGTRLVPETEIVSQPFGSGRGPFLGVPRVVALSDGGFVVSSTLIQGSPGRPNTFGLTLYWFDGRGQAAGPPVGVGSFPELTYDIAADAHGGLTVAITHLDIADRTGPGFASMVFHFDANHVSTTIAGPIARLLRLLPLKHGYVLFTLGADVTMQRLDRRGRPVGASQTLASSPLTARELADGSYVVISFVNGGYGAQRFAADGRALGQPMPIASNGVAPLVAALAEGGFVAGWTAPGSGGDADVFAQRFIEENDARKACLNSAKEQDLKGRARSAFVGACMGEEDDGLESGDG